ncbi:hypothetical protein N9F00_04120 [Planktomarina temperata]|nr:hypothetical protein [Planktomarina temperata]
MASRILADATASVTDLQKTRWVLQPLAMARPSQFLSETRWHFIVCQLASITRWSTGSMT